MTLSLSHWYPGSGVVLDCINFFLIFALFLTLCKRVHAITDTMLLKLEADYGKMGSQTLFSGANMARNSLQMWNDHYSRQLVLGKNPNLLKFIKDTLPALEGTQVVKFLLTIYMLYMLQGVHSFNL